VALVSEPAPAPRTNGEAVAAVLAGTAEFAAAWLARDGKAAVVVAAPARLDAATAGRLRAGAEAAGHALVLAVRTDADNATEAPLPVPVGRPDYPSGLSGPDRGPLFVLPDLSGAMLLTSDGYALLGGVAPFLYGAVPEGIDTAKARFARHVRRLGGQRSDLAQLAVQFRPQWTVWSAPADVPPGSAVGRQLDLMAAFAGGALGTEQFSTDWLAARRSARGAGERLGDRFRSVLDDVFYALDEFDPDPAHRPAGAMSEDDLITRVRSALAELRGL
jgi:hypothetical protein